MLISECLVSAGYVVRRAVDGLDAIGTLRAESPDLIISDLDMPRMSGLEFLGVVRKRFPQIAVIVMSAVASDEMKEAVAADAYYHRNGFGFDGLLQMISHLTRNPPRRGPPPHVENRPVQATWDGDGHNLIGCEDCLRVFSFPHTRNIRRDEKWTICVHCGGLVRFLTANGEL